MTAPAWVAALGTDPAFVVCQYSAPCPSCRRLCTWTGTPDTPARPDCPTCEETS